MAMPPAAAVPLRKVVGSVQNTGSTANTPKPAMDKESILPAGSSISVEAAMPAPATSAAKAVCSRRSPVRSECRPQYTMPRVPTT